MISAYVDDNQRNWDVPLLTSAYRSCQHETTGYSPNMLMLGRETHAPIDLMFGGPPQDEVHPPKGPSYRPWTPWLSQSTTEERPTGTRISHHNYAVGDLVYFMDSTKTPGLSPSKLKYLLFVLRLKQRRKSKVLHHDRFKTVLQRRCATLDDGHAKMFARKSQQWNKPSVSLTHAIPRPSVRVLMIPLPSHPR